MSDDIQQIERLMSTLLACRGMVRYNMMPAEQQKDDMLADIDAAVEMLRSRLMTGAALEKKPPSVQREIAEVHTAEISSLSRAPEKQQEEQNALKSLYRMYHAYLDQNQEANISTFVTRFNDVMAALSTIQQLATQSHGDVYTRPGVLEQPLQQIRAFIADLYCMFMDFIRMLSEALQQNNVHLDTEELSSVSHEHAVDAKQEPPIAPRDLLPLLRTYEVHRQLQEKRGLFSQRMSTAMVFLEFLKESCTTAAVLSLQKRDEIVAQLNTLGRLLYEMTCLLVDYEKAVRLLLTLK